MGIDKFVGEYIDEMMEPAGWPGVDIRTGDGDRLYEGTPHRRRPQRRRDGLRLLLGHRPHRRRHGRRRRLLRTGLRPRRNPPSRTREDGDRPRVDRSGRAGHLGNLDVQGWCRRHDKQLHAVVATEEQFANFDPGVAKIVLPADDIPDGTINGRSRLEAIAPDAAQRLIAVADTGLLNCTDKDTVTASGPTATVEVPLNGAPSAHRRLHPKRATAAGCRSRRAAVNEVLQKGNELLRPR